MKVRKRKRKKKRMNKKSNIIKHVSVAIKIQNYSSKL
jgi:hypothetical protein